MHDDLQRDLAHVWHPYTRRSTLTDEGIPAITAAEGIHLIAADGTRYVDAISSWWCVNLGHGCREIIEAIQRQAATLQHSILGNLTHPGAIELAGRLARLMPTPDRHVLFASDGSSAIEQAVKIAIQHRANTGDTTRTLVACLDGAYHGDTLGAMALGYLEQFHLPYKKHLFPVVRLPFPAADDFSEARALLDIHARELTAVVVEPLLQGASGMRLYSACWLNALASWCRTNGVILILDEIATGFGRTGTWFAYEQARIDPDIVCVGKGLSGGTLPISATIVRDAIYDSFRDLPRDHTLQHGHTFCGNPIACAAALAALDLYAGGVIERVPLLGQRLRAGVQPLDNHPRVRAIRHLGLMTAVELQAEPPPPPGQPTRAHRIRRALLARGILLRPLGPVLYLMPPLVSTEADLDAMAAALVEEVLRDAETHR
ncbi:MAG TPA: adenosylmethionine--8-amino-7-oxononanoate transaminase [Kiritimatiellia bacterium]|nr:adenosylmethionine--8-amino-7-oxononanoate transaminase [Kiritimatiellia bacterium]HMP33013.1 adenosylmethionine--8-amino-7-oxononanoate transaminase [Kiritimatiellia bacterium]